jgi:hypothetical protein
MPALSVSVDGEELATVATDGLSMIAIHLSGSRWDEDVATLDMSGGDYRGESESPHRIWIERPLHDGQVVKVSCVANAPTNPPGKTIAELYPDEPACTQTDFTPTAAMLEEISRRPLLRGGYTFRLSSSTGMEYTGHTRDDEYGFSFSVMWNAQYRPECARFSVRSITVEQLRKRSPARDHVRGDLGLGQSLRFQFTSSD